MRKKRNTRYSRKYKLCLLYKQKEKLFSKNTKKALTERVFFGKLSFALAWQHAKCVEKSNTLVANFQARRCTQVAEEAPLLRV